MAGTLIYLIGKSGSGKTTIAKKLYGEVCKLTKNKVQLIDGDEIRTEIGNLFGYTHEERVKQNQVVSCVVTYLLKNDVSVVLSQVCGFKDMQESMRNKFKPNYIEVYVKCSIEECIRRDVKGYYKKEIPNLNGVSDIYYEPDNPEIVVDTEILDVNECVRSIVTYIKEENVNI